MKAKLLAFVLSLCVAVAAFAATGSGFPSRPRFQSVTVVGGVTAAGATLTDSVSISRAGDSYLTITETGAALDEKVYRIRSTSGQWVLSAFNDALGANSNPIAIDRTGTVIDSIALTSTALTWNANPVTVETTGTFTASLVNACTTTPTIVFQYDKVGSQVTLTSKTNTGFPCTGDDLNFNTANGDVPVAIRPTAASGARSALQSGCTDNATATMCQVYIDNAGKLNFNKVSSAGVAGSFTAAGNRDAPPVGLTFSYSIANP